MTLSGGTRAQLGDDAPALTAGGYAYIGVYSGDSNYTGYTGAVEPLTISQGSLEREHGDLGLDRRRR